MSTNPDQPEMMPRNPVDALLQPIRMRLRVAAAIAGLGQIMTMIPLVGIAWIGEGILAGDDRFPFWSVALVSIGAMILGLLIITAAELLAHLADDRLTHSLRRQIADRLGRVALGWFTARASGSVKQAFQEDVNTLHELTAHYFTTRARCLSAIAFAGGFMIYVDWRLAIVAMIPFPLFHLIFGAARNTISEERMQSFAQSQSRINSATVEFVRGMPVLKVFGTTGKAHRSYIAAVEEFRSSFLGFTTPLIGPLANANALIAPVTMLVIVLAFGTLFLSLGWTSPADILYVALLAPAISAPFMLLSYIAHGLAHAKDAASRIDALLRTPIMDALSAEEGEVPVGNRLIFEGVGYAYEGGAEAVSGIDLVLEPGSITAIVGASGSGKSTLARLALRFFDPDHGCITLGGADLRRITPAELYGRVGFVLQDVRLLQASLHENIALGRMNASRAEVEAAARAAFIHDRIAELPLGYDSVIGRDIQLSGGEAQRISIARAILLDPPILILDEATAAVDAESEAMIQAALSRLAVGRTMMVIAHRLETIAHADRIVVLEQGRIHEEGTHEGLLQRDGRYAALWRLSNAGVRKTDGIAS